MSEKPARKTCGTIKRHGQVVWRDPSALVGYDRNSRTHSVEQIRQVRASIDEFGFTNPILLKGDEKTIGAGHARQLAALLDPPLEEVPTIVLQGLSAEQWRAYVIADNRLALNAGWDEAILSGELKLLDDGGFDLSLLGFNDGEIANLLNPLGEGLTDPDEVPKPPARPVTKPGDVWLLGKHRIVCGDSTDAHCVAKCLNGVTPHLMVTDPPYGVEYDAAKARPTSSGSAKGKVLNDDRADWREAWALFPGAVAYVWHGMRHAGTVFHSLEESGFEVRAEIVWAKSQLVMSRGHYHPQHESCWYAARGAANWSGDRKQTTLWQIDKPQKSETGHSTQKPVECMKRPIENNSLPGETVYEPFSGSGTTIIAGEMTGRSIHAIELFPPYVDVAVIRWQDFTGELATLEATGETFESLRAKRNRSVRRAGREAKAA